MNSAWAAEARAVREDHALAVGGELHFGQHLVRHAVHIGRGPLGDLARSRVVGVLPGRRYGHAELHLDEGLEVLGISDDLQVVQREDVVGLGLLHPEGLERFHLLRVLGRDVVRFRTVLVCVEQLPAIVVEAGGAGHWAVFGHGLPTGLPDAAVAEHLVVLRLLLSRCIGRGVERVPHRDTRQGRLRRAVDDRGTRRRRRRRSSARCRWSGGTGGALRPWL